jgi:hypothetical protein
VSSQQPARTGWTVNYHDSTGGTATIDTTSYLFTYKTSSKQAKGTKIFTEKSALNNTTDAGSGDIYTGPWPATSTSSPRSAVTSGRGLSAPSGIERPGVQHSLGRLVLPVGFLSAGRPVGEASTRNRSQFRVVAERRW